MRQIWALGLLAATLAGCTIDDSGPVRSVWRPENPNYAKTRVIYVTDREPDAAFPGGYATRWGGKASCGTAITVIPPAIAPGEAPRYGYVEGATPAQCTAPGKPALDGALALIRSEAAAKHCRSVFLFVHGFHTGFDGAVLRAAQVGRDTQTGCVIAAFSWSAEINTDHYVSDLEHSDFSAPLLAEFLRELSESGLRVTVLGHSLGSRLTLFTLSLLAQSREPPSEGFIDELVLAAGDIGTDPKNNDFVKLMSAAAPFAKRTTIYASRYDSVLDISRREHGGVPRLGSAVAPDFIPKAGAHEIDLIDASTVAGDRLDHSYYAMAPGVMRDMTLVLNGTALQDRINGAHGWPATLACGKPCAVAGKDGEKPAFSTRFIKEILPVIPLVR